MSELLLPYYQRELHYIRNLAKEFARENPKVASHLRLNDDTVEDPHVERLIEAFAFLTARVRRKLDDDFPELSQGLLSTLYPHYQAPLPSFAIVEMQAAKDNAAGNTVPSGTLLESAPYQGEPCRFQTCYDVPLWPISINQTKLYGHRRLAPSLQGYPEAIACLQIGLETLDKQKRFSELLPEKLRFFIRGQDEKAFLLYELIHNHKVKVALAKDANDPDPLFLDPDSIRPVGFAEDEGLLPYSARSFMGYRLLTEFFAFPEKFLFFDIDLPDEKLKTLDQDLNVFIYLDKTHLDLEHHVTAESLALGCTPMVNLFPHMAESQPLTQEQTEYTLTASGSKTHYEVYSIDNVATTSPKGEVKDFTPLYGVKHDTRDDARTYWQEKREDRDGLHEVAGQLSHMKIALVDLDLDTSESANWMLHADLLCTNHQLPSRLPFGGDEPKLQFSNTSAPVSRIRCLTAPTPSLRPFAKEGLQWRLISHLNLNHLSLENNEEGAACLREILRLYDFADKPETRALVEGVLALSVRRIVGRVPVADTNAFCQGLEISVELDEQRFIGSSPFLFSSILDNFFGLYRTINSFTQVVVTTKGNKRELCRFPIRY